MIKLKSIKTNFTIFKKQTITYWISFLIPMLVFATYFITKGGNILTVDLGQQYIDLLAFFRRNLFTHPLKLIYSFQNGLGGSLIATAAYYLSSPLNLILFLFSQKQLPIAIFIVISLKIGTIGLTSFYYWNKNSRKQKQMCALAASSAYALSGYVVANYFNLMWLDSLIFLPLLINAIDQILKHEKSHLILITFALWFTNFYTGLMTLFFGFLYLLSNIFIKNKYEWWPILKTYLEKSILGSFLDAFVLLPVFSEMLTGKAASGTNWSRGFQFPPYQELAKLADGAYNFHEMEEGLPNIFLTIPFLLLAIAYFLSKKINWRAKLANGLLLILLVASLFWTPLVLFWHLGQFPVWYPGRFSFLLIFLMLNLGITFLNKQDYFLLWQKLFLSVIAALLLIYFYFNRNSFDFLSQQNLLLTALFTALMLLFICFIYGYNNFSGYFLTISVVLELICNLVLALNNLSYQKNGDYRNFSTNTTQVTNYLWKNDHTLFRTEKNFYRSDDDPFTANYYGLSNFNSISNQKVINFMGALGYMHNNNSYTNYGGTPVSDALLGVKYYIEPNYVGDSVKHNQQMVYNNANHRLDLSNYTIKKEFKQLLLTENKQALPPLFLTINTDQKFDFTPDNPSFNQQLLLSKITGSKKKIFKNLDWPTAQMHNAVPELNDAMEYHKKDKLKNSNVSFTLNLKTNNSYYLELPSGLDDDQVDLYVNGNKIDVAARDDQSRLIDIANKQKGQKIRINFILKNKFLDLSAANLWSLKTKQLKQILQQFKKQQPSTYQPASLLISSSNFYTANKKDLASTIPYSNNWLIFDKQHLLKKKVFANTFLSATLTKGRHHLVLVYVPFAFLIGCVISLITLFISKNYK